MMMVPTQELTNIPLSGGCTTNMEEPWSARGPGRQGRKPPAFAEYTQVSCKRQGSRTCLGTLCGNLKMATQATDAHYIWLDAKAPGSERVEIWAHPDKIAFCAQFVRLLVDACQLPSSPKRREPRARHHRRQRRSPSRSGTRTYDLSEFIVRKKVSK